MDAPRKPLFLLADSQPLLRNDGAALRPALQRSLQISKRNITRAAYIGASNGDVPEFFELFATAMDGINLHETRMIRAEFGSEDRAFLESADLLLLAGGEVDDGWKIMTGTGMAAVIAKKYFAGAVIVGISAGAVQLGMGWYGKDRARVTPGLRLAPYYIGVHGERDHWRGLRALVAAREEYAKGFGIPFGGAMICHADKSLQAVRYPVTEFENAAKRNGRMAENLLLPQGPARMVTAANAAIGPPGSLLG